MKYNPRIWSDGENTKIDNFAGKNLGKLYKLGVLEKFL